MTVKNLMRKDPALARKAAAPSNGQTSGGTFSIRRSQYLTESGKQLLSAEQQRALINQVKQGDIGARRKMIAHNMHLVVDFAKRNANRGLTLLDLIREGTQGLLHALEKFEPEGGFSFSTYATWCIGHNIERAVLNKRQPAARSRATPAALLTAHDISARDNARNARLA